MSIEDEPEVPPSFLADPIESYLGPIIDDLVAHEAAERIPPELKLALSSRYVVQEELGRGGMATVYLAFDESLARPVAVKVLAPAVAESMRAERFTQEIKITSSLEHSSIVPIHDHGEAGGYLYYVMRYIEGGSLRDRLVREGKLAIDSAIAIAHDVASALDYANRKGVVHRDIKPENVLLEGDSAFVADFGVARLVDAAGRDRLTRTGVMIGTPQYMSPEQVDSGGRLDGRADVYSLACVMYEMLAGEPPFTGPTHQDILAKQLAAQVPPLSIVRPTVSPAMQHVLEVALQKTAVDRYATAGEFVKAFRHAADEMPESLGGEPVPPLPRSTRRRTVWALGVGLVLVAGALSIASGIPARLGQLLRFGSLSDTARVAVYPFQLDSASARSIQDPRLVGDAIRRWEGLTVVDELRMSELLTERTYRGTPSRFRALADELGAGRFVRGEISTVRDSIRIYGALYDVRTNRLIRDANARVATSMRGLDSVVADLAVQLLFGTRDPSIRAECLKTAIPRAYTACETAHAHVRQWRLALADSAFSSADTLDAQYADAHLWLAQVRYWRGEPAPRWRSAAERGYAQRATLDQSQQLRAEALWRAGRGDTELSCQLWEKLVRSAPDDFTAWYSLGVCLASDEIVLPDPRSPSGLRFRSSYGRALVAYRRAFELRPSILLAFKDRMFAGVREMFVTAPSVLRSGKALPPSHEKFLGRAAWEGDSLLFIPFPEDSVHRARPATRLASTSEAVLRQRRVFSDIAASWIASDPSSPAAVEALAIALEMLNDPGAIDTLTRARALSRTAADSLRIAVHEVWLRLKLAIPNDEKGMRRARAMADSLLNAHRANAAGQAGLLAGLAALTGRASAAAEFAQLAAATQSSAAETAVARPGAALLSFAALGGPTDSLRVLERRVAAAIESSLPEAERRFARQQWLARAATLSFPDIAKDPGALVVGDDPLLDVQLALLRGQKVVAERYIDDVRKARANVNPSDLSYDGIYPEAALLVALGNEHGAGAWIDPVLSALPFTAPRALGEADAAGAFVRTMALRASIANRAGDRAGARRWAKPVAILWSDADGFQQATVRQMTDINR